MTDQDTESSQCAVFDQTPGSQQKKINLVVRGHTTVQGVFNHISTQYAYTKFDLLLQPHGGKDLVYLNALKTKLLYDVPDFQRSTKNNLVLLPEGCWDGDVSKRYELPVKKSSANSKLAQSAATAAPPAPSGESTSATTIDAEAKSTGSTPEKKKRTVKRVVKIKTSFAVAKVKPKDVDKESKTEDTTLVADADDKGIKKDEEQKPTAVKSKLADKKEGPSSNSSEDKKTETTPVVAVDDKSEISPIAQNGTTTHEEAETSDDIDGTVQAISLVNRHNSGLAEAVDDLAKAEISEQLQKMPQNRILISPNEDALSELFNISPVSDAELLSDDDLALGASASPTIMTCSGYDFNSGGDQAAATSRDNEGDILNTEGDDAAAPDDPLPSITFYKRKYDLPAWQRESTSADLVAATTNEKEGADESESASNTARTNGGHRGYVGLVNQAMTCYLNSLLQALFMTPEFRNALYRWEFDNDNEAKNIPYQLQKLFLNLQTSPKSSVETTDLTRSFGWDSTEAWQQHDIQELCRVMFDALEHKFKQTKQANLISTLYEGKMNDYVKCLECNTEKTREDTFLDIPLPVRPFGSSSAYGSIEEALRAFVQPETLDGNNQYLCEKCNKKCDAHKGLKFKTFPYILTLHLKRFDFDYQTMHRIKLNDRVTFPQTLNLNSFVCRTESGADQYHLNGVGVDDCSTADSGSAIEEDNLSSGVVTTASSSQHENDLNDEDEGIDMSSSTGKSAQLERIKQESGPYLYELFAIMIHSGSASGGHYYAYIKDFDSNEWFCFNDQNVSSITQEDIQRSFGGASGSYYSSAYTPSTNAYMLMYRQVDTKRNEQVAKVADFPEHIKTLLPKLHAEEETRVTRLGRHSTVTDLVLPDLYKPRVYFYNPSLKKLKMTRVYVSQSFDINLVLMSAYEMLNVEQLAPMSRCRLVAYDSSTETIIQSLETCTDPALTELRSAHNMNLDFLLEYCADGQKFENYVNGGTTWYVYIVDLTTKAMDGPFFVFSAASEPGDVLRHSIAARLHIDEHQFSLATVRGASRKAFVAPSPRPTPEAQHQLQQLANTQFKYITYFYLNVPNTDSSSLEILGVPTTDVTVQSLEANNGTDVVDAALMNGIHGEGVAVPTNDCDWRHQKREFPLASLATPGHESNSEDSSLSDGDRTLVESLQHRGGGDSHFSSNSHSPQLSSPEDEAASHDAMMRVHAYCNGNSYGTSDIDSSSTHLPPSTTHFFHASKIDCVEIPANNSSSASDEEAQLRKPTRAYKLLVGTHMRIAEFKRHIEQLIQVPSVYFKLQRKHDNPISNSLTNSLVFLNEGETLTVEIGKQLQADEYKAKIYFLRLSELDNETSKLPCICEWVYTANTTAAEAIKELVPKLSRIDSKYADLSIKNCRIWLKGGRSPIKILTDDETLYCDMRSNTTAAEFILQECEDGIEPQPNDDALTIFVRRWDTDKWQFGPFQEITLDRETEIRSSLSKISGIPEDNISYMKVNSSFPCTSISALSVNEATNWFSVPGTQDSYPLKTTLNGNIYLYKDDRVPIRDLSRDERRELRAQETARLDRLGCISTTRYSQRRERALKIYLDSPEKVTASAPVDANAED